MGSKVFISELNHGIQTVQTSVLELLKLNLSLHVRFSVRGVLSYFWHKRALPKPQA